MLLVSDQGGVVTVNGGETWSSWYNQPTAQFYHVTADNAWPYRLCGGQQESGSACVKSRGDFGAIDYRDWTPVGTEEYGYVAPDPLDPDIVYGDKVEKFDRRTGQTASVTPNVIRRGPAAPATKGEAPYRVIRTEPIMFSPTNPHKLYFASNVVWQTVNGGQQLDRDQRRSLAREVGRAGERRRVHGLEAGATSTRRGVVYALAPSPVDSNTIWAGTDDGLIWVTRNNGKLVEQRDAAAARAVGEGEHHRREPLRCERSVRGGEHDPAQRAEAAHLSHEGWRQKLDGDRDRHGR